jgi:hypothetical protein
MKTQTTYAKAPTLGPFLTLILLSSPERGTAASEQLRSSTDVPAVGYNHLVAREEALNESKPASRPPLTLGPMLTLILTSRRSQPLAGER